MSVANKVDKPGINQIIKNGFIAIGVAVVVNLMLFFIGSAKGAFPDDVLNPMGVPIDAIAVTLLTIVGIGGGTVVYFGLTRLVNGNQANRIFIIISILVLFFFALSPVALEGSPPVIQIVILEIMHLVAGFSAIFFLTRSK